MVPLPHHSLSKLGDFAQVVPPAWKVLDPLSILHSCFKAQGSHIFLGKKSLTPCKTVYLPLCHHVLLATFNIVFVIAYPLIDSNSLRVGLSVIHCGHLPGSLQTVGFQCMYVESKNEQMSG